MAEQKTQQTKEEPKSKTLQDYTYEEQIELMENEIENLNKRITYLQGRKDALQEFIKTNKKSA